MNNDEMIGTFVGLFEWAYQIQIPPQYRQGIEQHLRAGWFNEDRSEHTLVAFVLDLSARLQATWNPDEHRAGVQQHFANEFRLLTQVSADLLNDKYRILAVVHSVIESLRPGATGLPLPGGVQGQQTVGRGTATAAEALAQQEAALALQEEMLRKRNVQMALDAINLSRANMISNMARWGH